MEDEAWSIVGALQDAFGNFLNAVGDALPRVIGFLLIFFIGWMVARFVAKLIGKLLHAVNIDRYLDRAGIGGPLERAGYADSGRFVTKLIYYMMMLFVFKASFEYLGIAALNGPLDQLIVWIPKALVALALIVIGGLVARVVRDIVSGLTAGQSYGNFLTNLASLSIWVIFGLAALDQADIAPDLINTLITTLFASLGGILIIQFGVGGIWAARDRFWPKVYDTIESATSPRTPDARADVPHRAAAQATPPPEARA